MANSYAAALGVVAVLEDPSCANTAWDAYLSEELQRAALLSGNLEQDRIEQAAARGGKWAGWAASISQDANWIKKLEETGGTLIKRGLARNPLASPRFLDQVIKENDDLAALNAMANANSQVESVRARLEGQPRMVEYALDADRAVTIGSILRTHPELTSWAAAHRDNTIRRLAMRMPNLTLADLEQGGAPAKAGRRALKANPNLPPDGMFKVRLTGQMAARHIDEHGRLREGVDLVAAAMCASDSVDLAIAQAITAGQLTVEQIREVAQVLLNGQSLEPDVLADLLVDTRTYLRAFEVSSGSRIAGAARRNQRLGALEATWKLLAIPPWIKEEDLRIRKEQIDQVLHAGRILAQQADVDVWKVTQSAAVEWEGSLEELMVFGKDSLHIAPVRKLRGRGGQDVRGKWTR